MSWVRDMLTSPVRIPNAHLWRLPTLGLVIACPMEGPGGRIGYEVSIILDGVVSDDLRQQVLAAVQTKILRELDLVLAVQLRSVGKVESLQFSNEP